MKVNIKDLKKLSSKLSIAIEKSALNPKSSWIELETLEDRVVFKVSNFNYFLKTYIEYTSEEKEDLHVTISAETFIPLISKLDVDEIDMQEKLNCLILTTDKSSYTFPIIKELGNTKLLDTISFNATSSKIEMNGGDLASVANVNTKGLIDAMFSRDIQRFIYMDNLGAITFTENIYVNDFKFPSATGFRVLLTNQQATLLKVFEEDEKVELELEQAISFNSRETTSNKVRLSSYKSELILVTQDSDVVDKFPSIRLRALAENPLNTHIEIDKKSLDRALARLMVFDKKFDITVLNYSKLVFKEDCLELISIKNKNKEIVDYKSSGNVVPHEAVIRFADLVKQLKAVINPIIDISYGDKPALVLNSNVKQIIPEIQLED